jgi:hypothetical protein
MFIQQQQQQRLSIILKKKKAYFQNWSSLSAVFIPNKIRAKVKKF